jgi:hypothetical protein
MRQYSFTIVLINQVKHKIRMHVLWVPDKPAAQNYLFQSGLFWQT